MEAVWAMLTWKVLCVHSYGQVQRRTFLFMHGRTKVLKSTAVTKKIAPTSILPIRSA